MDFVAIDVETANADVSSICQIGIAHYLDGELKDEWKSYIDPEDFFDGMNIYIHGIDENTVAGASKLFEVKDLFYTYLDGKIAVCHTHFDRAAVNKAFLKYRLRLPDCTWLDSARVTRRAWEDFSKSGYGLENVCNFLGYDFQHHDALEDAKAAAHIIMEAIKKTGIDIDGWLTRVEQPINLSMPIHELRVNPEGHYFGERLVFTGELKVSRSDAAKIAANAGFDVQQGVTKKTTVLVVGDQDIKKLAGHEKSSKHRNAEDLIAKGHRIRVIGESDFFEVVELK